MEATAAVVALERSVPGADGGDDDVGRRLRGGRDPRLEPDEAAARAQPDGAVRLGEEGVLVEVFADHAVELAVARGERPVRRRTRRRPSPCRSRGRRRRRGRRSTTLFETRPVATSIGRTVSRSPCEDDLGRADRLPVRDHEAAVGGERDRGDEVLLQAVPDRELARRRSVEPKDPLLAGGIERSRPGPRRIRGRCRASPADRDALEPVRARTGAAAGRGRSTAPTQTSPSGRTWIAATRNCSREASSAEKRRTLPSGENCVTPPGQEPAQMLPSSPAASALTVLPARPSEARYTRTSPVCGSMRFSPCSVPTQTAPGPERRLLPRDRPDDLVRKAVRPATSS